MLDQPYRSSPPKTWLVESILATLFCCLPFGIVGIIFAASVESKFNAGDYDGADRASADAKKWTMVSFWAGVAVIVIYCIILGFIFFFSAQDRSFETQQ